MVIPSESTRLLLKVADGSAKASEELRSGLRDSVRALRQATRASSEESAARADKRETSRRA